MFYLTSVYLKKWRTVFFGIAREQVGIHLFQILEILGWFNDSGLVTLFFLGEVQDPAGRERDSYFHIVCLLFFSLDF